MNSREIDFNSYRPCRGMRKNDYYYNPQLLLCVYYALPNTHPPHSRPKVINAFSSSIPLPSGWENGETSQA